jgi:PKD repeat protein
MKIKLLAKFSLINIMLLILMNSNLNSQITSKGKDFWFAFMDNVQTNPRFTQIYITSEVNASGTVSIPKQGWTQNFSVTANSTAVIDVPIDVCTMRNSEVVEGRGIQIISNNEVNVFAMNYAYTTSDGTLVLPTNALGTNYYALTYSNITNQASEFVIVAVEDATTVMINPRAATIGGKAANVPFSVTLNKGETYLVKANGDLSGSTINSVGAKKPFALFSGNKCSNIPVDFSYCNHLVEQMYPIATWRRNYVAIPYLTRVGDTYRILASKPGTVVKIDNVVVATLNAGEFFETIKATPSFITANYPIAVAQFSNGSGYDKVANSDPFMIMLSPVEQTRTDITFEVFTFASIDGNYVNLAAKTSCVSNIRIDGNPITNWNPIPSNPAYSYSRVTLTTQGSHRVNSIDPDCGFNAYVYGYGLSDSYGYSAGVSLDTLSAAFVAFTNCVGKDTEFFVKSQPYTILNYSWTFGDGGTSKIADPKYKYSKAGQYKVRLIVQYDDNSLDTVFQNITISGIKAEFSVSGGGCIREIQVDNASVGIFDSYLSCNWLFGDGGTAKGNSVKHTYAKAGNYAVKIIAESANHCFDTLTKIVKIFDPPQPIITPLGPMLFCTCDSVVLDAGNLGYVSYLWSNGETSQKIVVKTTNKFTVTVIDTNGCKNTSPSVSTQTISPSTSISFLESIITVSTGNQFKYNIILKPESNINICKVQKFRAVLSYKKTIFVPAGNTALGTMDNYRRYFEISGSWNGRDSLIATLDFLATLGDSVAGDIRIDSFAWTECDLPSVKGTSIVVLDDLCKEGGITRLFKSDNKAIYLSVIPNPVGKDALIEFDIKKKDNCKIDLYDLLGNKVKEIFNGNVEPGVQSIKLNSMELTNGSYYLIVNTNGNSTKQLIQVQK